MSISEALKQAITDCGESVYAVSKGSGVSHPIIYRFVNGERLPSLENVDRLAAYLGLELRPVVKAKSKRK